MSYPNGAVWAVIRRRGVIAAMAAVALVAGLLIPAMTAKAAAGTAVLDVSVQAVDSRTGAPQAQASFGTHDNQVAYKVAYSCAAADCDGATVQLSPSQPDPNGLQDGRLLAYANWTPPAGLPNASVGGTDVAGKTISLGDLRAGVSGTFLVVYGIAASGNNSTVAAAQYYPSGFQILMSATMDSTTATGPAQADAQPVTWTSKVPEPSLSQVSPGSVKPGTNVSWELYMASGAITRFDGSSVRGSSEWVGAGSYTVVEKLDPRAVYVSSTGSGVYDSAAHTVTWSHGTKDAPDAVAAGGWGHIDKRNWSARGNSYPRKVTVNYPAAKFTNDPSGCDFEETVSSEMTVSLTYLDPDRTTKTATEVMQHTVSCHSPFARAGLAKDSTSSSSSGSTRLVNVPPNVAGMTCPARGRDDWNRVCTPGASLAPFADNRFYWTVAAHNQSNVDGVAVIQDDELDQPDARVNRIEPSGTTPVAKVEWTRNDGATGTSNGAVNAPDGTWFTKAKVTSGTVKATNVRPSDTGGSPFNAYFYYNVAATAPIGETRTNRATATMSWPDSGLAVMALGPTPRTIRFQETPRQRPSVTAAFASPATVEGGGNAVPGKNVTFKVRAETQNIPGGVDITPQYAFIAPVGWTINPDSASFAAGSVPDGVSFDYTTKTVGGQSREVVVANWPNDVSFGENTTWPTMQVMAQPTHLVAAGTTSVATAWAGDSRHTWTNAQAVYAGAVADTPDIDGDGKTDEWFSGTAQNVTVSAADGLSATKEICLPTPGAPQECTWLSDPDELVGVSPTATDIRYRVTLKNTGNTTLDKVVAYDVLPHEGDRGTSAGTASTPRGSTFDETLDTVSDVSANLTLEYSASTNPKRAEVHPAATGTTDDWGPTPAGKKAIRASVTGALTPGQEARFIFVAAVAPGTKADAVACNSVALDSAQTLPAEPRPVCASTQEADLSVGVPDRLPLQVGRVGVLPFTVTNGGGSQETAATVTVTIPTGLTVTSLTPKGWSCTAEPGSAPLDGPLTLTCTPVDDDGDPKPLKKGVATDLAVPVMPTALGQACALGSAEGPMHDPTPANNKATGCAQVGVATTGLSLTKTDGRDVVAVGDEYSYTLTAANLLPAETITGTKLTDTLPAGLAFVSATGGGTVADQGAVDAYGDRPGGTVTWTLGDLGRAGVPSPGGDLTEASAEAAVSVQVRVKVLPGASGTVVNSARVSAPDPADASETLTANASDTDRLRALTLTKSSGISSAGVSAGDTVTYTVTAKNIGTADYTESVPAVVSDDLAGVLDDAVFTAGSASASIDDGSSE
ncbi:isopeptide-forming domain-containing fimbrial protein, partial [Streptomyces albipurpureus]